MGNVGGGEILVILLVALIFLGPEKLPEVARQVGKVVGEIRKVTSGFQREMQDAMRLIDDAVKEGEKPAPVDAITVEAHAEPAPVDADAVVLEHPVDAVVLDDAPQTDPGPEPTPAPASDAPPLDAPAGEAPPFASEAPPLASEAPPLPVADTVPYDTAHGGDR